jgi:hypothetical protein
VKIRVAPHLVALVVDLFYHFGIVFGHPAQNKECSFPVFFFELLKDFFYRPVNPGFIFGPGSMARNKIAVKPFFDIEGEDIHNELIWIEFWSKL